MEINKTQLKTLILSSRDAWISDTRLGLFLASFLSLFLELLLIRWVPSLIRVVAYYGNLMLISSFLGLGCGVLLARRRLDLYRWFPHLLCVLVIFVIVAKGIEFHQGADELRFLFKAGKETTVLPIVLVFILNALIFIPWGEMIGGFFNRLPSLEAYSWDLGGAISGTVAFGIFSYFWFSPIFGVAVVMACFLFYCRSKLQLAMTVVSLTLTLAVMLLSMDKTAIWSPYSLISVREVGANGKEMPVSVPVTDIAVMRDPPFYTVQVNQDFYMWSGTIDDRRYARPAQHQISPRSNIVVSLRDLAKSYSLPHLIRPGAKKVLVVGSGAGVDVEGALLAGVESVDAVEIDPVILRVGHRYNASQSYRNPRVSIYNTDARAFFKHTNKSYDMVIFGLLDSQGIFSQMSNIRLDGYVYTRESFQEAFGLLQQGGVLSVSFFSSRKKWLLDRLVAMVKSASGAEPLVYVRHTGQVMIFAGKGFVPKGPNRFESFRRIQWTPSETVESTDDWPYLYLRQPFIPADYLITIGFLLFVCVCFLFFSSDKNRKGIDLHFFFLGAGFLLLETKSITTISLYFGTTWLVSMIVILGVLIMVFVANLVVFKLKRVSLLIYIPIVVSIGFLYFFPTQTVLAWSFPVRLAYSLMVIPLPIFFAGIIFSSTLRESPDPSYAFGSNLLGAMVGGFVEYLGMISGTKALLLVVLVFYLMSLLVRLRNGQILPATT